MTSDTLQEQAGRRHHYGEFYGLRPLPPDDGRPLLVVHGNCQAESLRVLLAGTDIVRSVRIPAVHELEPDDLPHLQRTLSATQVLVTQPVRADYRDLPVGTEQAVALLPQGARVIRFPVVRYAGLFPFQAIVRAPGVGDPPVVPYHDLRTLVEAATGVRPAPAAAPAAYRQIEADSIAELARREAEHDTLVASDLLRAAGAEAAHTINHPGNRVLRGIAERVLARLGHPSAVADPGRTLLDSVHAPLAADVLDALDLPGPAREHWVVGGEDVEDARVREEQLRWYAAHEQVVTAGLERHRDALAVLGLA